MAEIKKGNFELDLKIVKLGVELSEVDRQCAWELYSEIVTRVAASGKRGDDACTDFSGELLAESFISLFELFRESRAIMKRFPVGRIKDPRQDHLGNLIQRYITHVLRPFLEKWRMDFRQWWEFDSDKRLSELERQNKFPNLNLLLSDWTSVKLISRALEKVLVSEYRLQSID